MKNLKLADILARTKYAGRITEQDTVDMRAVIFGDGGISLSEADTLFEVNFLGEKPPCWNELFSEAISCYLVEQTLPYGYVSAAGATWLIARISHDGVVETSSELEVLMRVLHKAKDVPGSLERFALSQVKEAVVHGSGLIGRARKLEPGVIGAAEVELLRRMIYACSGDGGVSISRMEAELLFDLNDACQMGVHHESWQHLFVGAIASHLMTVAAWKAPDWQEAVRREQWLNAPGSAYIVPKFSGFTKALRDFFTGESESESFENANEAKAAIAEAVSGPEAVWLIERIKRDRHLTPNEIALLDFLKAECPQIHTALMPLIRASDGKSSVTF